MKKFYLALSCILFLNGCALNNSKIRIKPNVQSKVAPTNVTTSVVHTSKPEVEWRVPFTDTKGVEIEGADFITPQKIQEQAVVRIESGKSEVIIDRLLARARTKRGAIYPMTAATWFEPGDATVHGLTLMQMQDPEIKRCGPVMDCHGLWYVDWQKKDVVPLPKVTALMNKSAEGLNFPDDDESAWALVIPGTYLKDCVDSGRIMYLVNVETDQVVERIKLEGGQSFSSGQCVIPSVRWASPTSITYTVYNTNDPNRPELGTYTINTF